MLRTHLIAAVVLSFSLMVSACGSTTPASPTAVTEASKAPEATKAPEPTKAPEATKAPEPTKAPEATKVPEATKIPEATKAPEGNTGLVGDGMLVAIGGGEQNPTISVLTKDGWQKTVEEDLGACLNHSNLLVDASSNIWAICSNVFKSSDMGKSWKQVKVPFNDEFALVETSFLDDKDQIWLVTGNELAVLSAKDSSVVEQYTSEETTKEKYFPNDAIAITKDGVLWLGGLNIDGSAVISFDGKAWTAYGKPEDMGLESYENPTAMLTNAQGAVQIVAGNGIYELKDKKLDKVADINSDVSSPNQIVQLKEGDLLMGSLSGVARVSDGKTELITREDGLPSNFVRSVAMDSAGRTWAATEYGLAVQDGGKWQVALPSNSGLGSSRVYHILVQGAPPLPAAEAKEKTTTVTGRIIENGAPIAKTKVQLCAESPSMFIKESPCEEQEFQKIVETDADGKFSFENVPLASYGIAAVNGEGKWIIFLADIPGREGDTVDLGDVDLTKSN